MKVQAERLWIEPHAPTHAAIGFAFEVVQADATIAVADPDNLTSVNVMRRRGMGYQGSGGTTTRTARHKS